MKKPVELNEYLKALKPSSIPLRFAETLEYKNDVFITHLWAIKFHKDYEKPLVKEVFRQSEISKEINSDFYFSGMGGWRVAYESKKTAYYGTIKPQNKFLNYEGNNPGVEKTMLWNIKDIKALDPRLQYLTIRHFATNWNIIDFIKKFREEPSLEMLAKMNIEYLYTDNRVFKLKGQKKKDFISWVSSHQDYILKNKINYSFITNCLKHNLEPKDYEKYSELRKYRTELKEYKVAYEVNEMPKLMTYLEKQNKSINAYLSYLEIAKKLNKNMKDYGVKYPRDLEQTTNALQKLLEKEEAIKLKKQQENKLAIYKNINNHVRKLKGFTIFVPTTPKELVKLGEEMGNCLSTYTEKITEGNCLVFAFEKSNQPVECCELKMENTELSLVQLRGKYNQDSKYHNKLNLFINDYLKGRLYETA